MKALLHAELLKLRTTRTTAGLLLATLALVALTVAVNVPAVGDENAPLSLDDPGLLADAVGVSFGVPLVLVVLFGTLAFTQEFRYGTVTSTYLGEPRRKRVLVAKWMSLALASVVITAATLALSVALGIALIRSRDGDVTLAGHFWGVVASGFVVMAAYGLIWRRDWRARPQPDRCRGRRAGLDARRRADRHPHVPGRRTLDARRSDQRAVPARPRDEPRREAAAYIGGWSRPRRVHGRGSPLGARGHAKEGRPVKAHECAADSSSTLLEDRHAHTRGSRIPASGARITLEHEVVTARRGRSSQPGNLRVAREARASRRSPRRPVAIAPPSVCRRSGPCRCGPPGRRGRPRARSMRCGSSQYQLHVRVQRRFEHLRFGVSCYAVCNDAWAEVRLPGAIVGRVGGTVGLLVHRASLDRSATVLGEPIGTE